MRKRVWIVSVIIAIICLLFALHRTATPKIDSSNLELKLTNQVGYSSRPAVSNSSRYLDRERIPGAFPQASAPSEIAEKSNANYQRLMSEWQAPIDFYGKVLDENGNPVPGVEVHFNWSETPFDDGQKSSATESDLNGLFSLTGQRGSILEVWTRKDGYYVPKPGFQSYNYSLSGHFSPDARNPIIFTLRKKGNPEPLVMLKRNYRIPRDGTPVSIDLATGTSTAAQDVSMAIQCWTEDEGKKSGQKYNWHCRISMRGGGILVTNEEFLFLAPVNGYLPSTEIEMLADRPDWKDDVDVKFYYRLADGRYGRMTFSMIAGGQHFCMIDSALNPSGSRSLEPAN